MNTPELYSALPAVTVEPLRKHAPGPWKRTVCKNENQMGYVSVISGADDSGVCEVNREANARLIAAAPDLLAALEDAVSEVGCYLHAGGLFNPEMMEHDEVRKMLIRFRGSARKAIASAV